MFGHLKFIEERAHIQLHHVSLFITSVEHALFWIVVDTSDWVGVGFLSILLILGLKAIILVKVVLGFFSYWLLFLFLVNVFASTEKLVFQVSSWCDGPEIQIPSHICTDNYVGAAQELANFDFWLNRALEESTHFLFRFRFLRLWRRTQSAL